MKKATRATRNIIRLLPLGLGQPRGSGQEYKEMHYPSRSSLFLVLNDEGENKFGIIQYRRGSDW
jgi:hypothetical protein